MHGRVRLSGEEHMSLKVSDLLISNRFFILILVLGTLVPPPQYSLGINVVSLKTKDQL